MKGRNRRKKLALAVVALGILGAHSAVAQETGAPAAEGKDVEFTAQVVDLSCNVVYGLSGEEHRTCAQVCAISGIPLGLLSAEGELYLPVSQGMPGTGANEQLTPLAERQVRVTGKVIERGGLNTIIIERVEAIAAGDPGG